MHYSSLIVIRVPLWCGLCVWHKIRLSSGVWVLDVYMDVGRIVSRGSNSGLFQG